MALLVNQQPPWMESGWKMGNLTTTKRPDGLDLLEGRGVARAGPRVAGVQAGARAVRGGVPGTECAVITL